MGTMPLYTYGTTQPPPKGAKVLRRKPGTKAQYETAPRSEANMLLAQRATRHMAMRSLRIPPVHGEHCNCRSCTVRKHAKAVR